MNGILQQDIQYLPGVGPSRKKMLNDELGIQTFGDLLQYYPYKHVDRSRLYSIGELNGDMPFVQVKGHILSFETFKMSARKERVVAHFTDGSGKVMDLTWFNGGKYAKRTHQRDPSRYGSCRKAGTISNGYAALLQHFREDEEGRTE